jgi:hypothetical protein
MKGLSTIGIVTRIAEALARIKPTEPLRLDKWRSEYLFFSSFFFQSFFQQLRLQGSRQVHDKSCQQKQDKNRTCVSNLRSVVSKNANDEGGIIRESGAGPHEQWAEEKLGG